MDCWVVNLGKSWLLSEGRNHEVLFGEGWAVLEEDAVASAVDVILLLGSAGAADDGRVDEVDRWEGALHTNGVKACSMGGNVSASVPF